jgi:hypothetical protein
VPETIVALDVGCRPEAAISGAVLVKTEHSTFLTFNALRLMRDGQHPAAGTALVEFIHCTATKFGYPNDEARWGIPRFNGLVYGFYEVLDSEWKVELAILNSFAFPDTGEWHGRHFLLTFHDTTFECLADDFKLEVIDKPYSSVFARIAARVVAE